MIEFPIPKKYTMQLDNIDKRFCTNYVAEHGAEGAVERQLQHLDCTRVKGNLRLMQTIGVPYQYEMSKLAYILYTYFDDEDNKVKYYLDKLVEIHKANIEYERDNPPIIYDKTKKVSSARTTRKKFVETTLDGFEKPKRESTKALNANVRAAIIGNIKLSIK